MNVYVRLICFLCLFSLCASAVSADDGVYSIVHENDLFSQRDQYYTSGVRLSWFSDNQDVPGWLENVADNLQVYRPQANHRVSYSIGQNMFTPLDITDPNPPEDDRPYAGWLYLSGGVIQDRGNRLDTLEVTVGLVGPSTRAEEIQEEVHDFVGADDPQGWDTQLHDELGVKITYGQRNIYWTDEDILGKTFELMPGYQLSVGNILTAAEVSMMLRWGDISDHDYGPSVIRSSIPGTGFYQADDNFDWYLYTNFSGRYVARDLFLDGNTIRDSRSVDKEPWLGEAQVGIVLTWSDYQLSYTHVFPTREFETQQSRDDYGAITLSSQF